MTDYPPSPIRYPLVLDYTSILENKPIKLTVNETLVYVCSVIETPLYYFGNTFH